ncbi:putative polyadenylation protein Ecym_5147 [Eremothecium cymbalariae DBVPG|uniref:Uncharacterized protein n=1 Tax=Eremothecium cymbalariae (strain CBS 270.75 / DBVPG 7215 / KCTC 17166 / NRRL Y-17582) TaxID=931890 RepID=I6NCY2_ERECY|nr:hypothetical protein Ecym_5147 [Eremothecium cymbalariae DBVPG\
MKFFAEHLPRIGIVLIVVVDITGELVIQGIQSKILKLKDSIDTVSIILPCEVEFGTDTNITYQNGQATIRAHERKVNLKSHLDRTSNFMVAFSSNFKWSKLDLQEPFKFLCYCCNSTLLSRSDCKKIRDMPTEFWTELMDYWHCHKPDDNSKESKNYRDKYNILVPSIAELLVGDSFLILNRDWLSERFLITPEGPTCQKCSTLLGELPNEKVIKLYKWNLILIKSNGIKERYGMEQSVIASLMNLINSNASRVIILSCGNNSKTVLWVFSIGLNVTLSDNTEIKQGLKFLYTTDLDILSSGKVPSRQTVDTLNVTPDCYRSFIESLDKTRDKLPEQHKMIDNWYISYVSYL